MDDKGTEVLMSLSHLEGRMEQMLRVYQQSNDAMNQDAVGRYVTAYYREKQKNRDLQHLVRESFWYAYQRSKPGAKEPEIQEAYEDFLEEQEQKGFFL